MTKKKGIKIMKKPVIDEEGIRLIKNCLEKNYMCTVRQIAEYTGLKLIRVKKIIRENRNTFYFDTLSIPFRVFFDNNENIMANHI